MKNTMEINSASYWDMRFIENWDAEGGAQQSRDFARLIIDNLPSWFVDRIRSDFLSIADWGSAQGDGTDVLANFFTADQVTGIDFSSVAIEKARLRYPEIRFLCEDWTSGTFNNEEELFDVIFSSNTLEHFYEPYNVLENISKRAKKAIVLALPYREKNRINEHFFSFFSDNIPLILTTDFQLIWSKVIDCTHIPESPWPGHQIVLVYASMNWVSKFSIMLNDARLEVEDFSSIEKSFSGKIIERDKQIVALSRCIQERDDQIAELSQCIQERDDQVAALSRCIQERDDQVAALSQCIQERDDQISDLNHALNNRVKEIIDLNRKISKILQSTSWRITSPIRVAKNIALHPGKTIYSISRAFFWKLPPVIRQALHRPRHVFVRYVRGLPDPKVMQVSKPFTADLSWSDFNDRVLSHRDNYKGIFVQELVIDWHVPLYQRPQHIAVAMGILGYLVIYRTDNWADDDVNGFREVSKNVWITNRHEVEQISGTVRSIYSTAYAHTPDRLRNIKHQNKLVYEYIDHIDSDISGDEANIRRLNEIKEFAFDGGVDYIVTSAKNLYDEAVKAVGKHKVIHVPNGVDTTHYRSPEHKKTPLPNSLITFQNNHDAIIGYFGALAPWLWYEVIAELSEQRPELGFVFIGPDYYGASINLPKTDNVLYMGTVDYKILPAYANTFDVCFIPFKKGDIAKSTSPLKLFEYFALEKPVVVTSYMAECTAFPEVFRGGTTEELSDAIDKALQVKDKESFRLRLRELADQNNWNQRVLDYERVFSPRVSIDEVQNMICQCHKMDNDSKTYYEDAYMSQELLYWKPVPRWIDELEDIHSVIDVGAAYGTLLTYVALNKSCREIYAVDPVGYMSSSLIDKIGINLIRADFERDGYCPNIKFDLIIFTEVIEHLNFHPLPTLLRLKRLLNPGGKLLLTTPDAEEWGRVTDYYSSLDDIPEYDAQAQKVEWIDGHIWQYTKEELDSLFSESGFEVLKFDYSPGVSARHLCYLLGIDS